MFRECSQTSAHRSTILLEKRVFTMQIVHSRLSKFKIKRHLNKGKIIIAVKYDRVDQFADGLARVKLDDKFGFIDKNGKVIIPIKLSDSHNFVKGLASACDDRNLWGLLSKNGQWVIKPQFMTMENINGTEFTSVLYSDKPQTKKGKTEAFKKALISPNGKILWCSGNPPQIK